MFNLAVCWLKLVYQEKVNPVRVHGLHVRVHVCVPVGTGVCESCEGRDDAGVSNIKETDQGAQGVDARCEVIAGKKQPPNFLCISMTEGLDNNPVCALTNTHSGSSEGELDELQGRS